MAANIGYRHFNALPSRMQLFCKLKGSRQKLSSHVLDQGTLFMFYSLMSNQSNLFYVWCVSGMNKNRFKKISNFYKTIKAKKKKLFFFNYHYFVIIFIINYIQTDCIRHILQRHLLMVRYALLICEY